MATNNAEQVLVTVQVQLVQGAHGPRYTVHTAAQGQPLHETLCTANAHGSAWEHVERHVRAPFDQLTAAERLANALHALVEQHGLDSAVGQHAQEALIEVGLD